MANRSRKSSQHAEYYQNLFTSSNQLDIERVIELVDHVVTEEMAQSLVRPYIEEEVRTAFFQMHPSKSLGLMVCRLSFFKNSGTLLEMMLLLLFYLSYTQEGTYRK